MFKTTNPDNYVGVEDSTGLAAIFLVSVSYTHLTLPTKRIV